MIELIRIINEDRGWSYRATQNSGLGKQLDLMLEENDGRRSLITGSFNRNLPLSKARFRPEYGRNVFYASFIEETALYEQAFYCMKECVHLSIQ